MTLHLSTHIFRPFTFSPLFLLPVDGGSTKVLTVEDSTHGNIEGVEFDSETESFFVGATGDGTIYRGTLARPDLEVFLPGAPGRSAVGMKAVQGRLYVAGGTTGLLTVIDIGSGKTLASFDTGTGGFVNDLVVTEHGDVLLTDSFRPTLWRVRAAQVAAGYGTPQAIPVEPEIPYTPGTFNLNGIVSLREGKELVVVNSANGNLYRIDLGGNGDGGDPSRERRITRIDVDPLPGGDGLLLDRGRLLVVQGGQNALAFVHLHDSRGEIEERRTDPSLRGPSTVARAYDRYLVVNADFATSRTPFTVSILAR